MSSVGRRVEMNSSQMMERDLFKKCLDLLLNKQKVEELDDGERESILDAIKSDLPFCQ
jgi:hypothetical protein